MDGKVCISKGMENTIEEYVEVEVGDVKTHLKICNYNCFEITQPINFKGRTADGLNRVYLDLDGKIPADYTEEQYTEIHNKIRDELIVMFPNEFLMTSSQYKIKKLSYRIHYQTRAGTRTAVKLYVEKFVVPLFSNWNACLFGEKHKTQTQQPYLELDLTIYNKNRKMRMLYCKKDYKDENKKRHLEDRPLLPLRDPTDDDLIKSLITYTKDCEILPETYPKEKVVPVDETGEADPIEEVMAKVLEGLNASRYDTTQYWKNVGKGLKGSNLPFEMWDEWSKKSSKYKEGECRSMWDGWKSLKQTQTIIWAYLKTDNPELYNELIVKRTDLRLLIDKKYSDVLLASFFYNLNPHEYMNGNLGWYELDRSTNIWEAHGGSIPAGVGQKIYDTFLPITSSFVEMYKELNERTDLTEGGKLWNAKKIEELEKFNHYIGQNKTHTQVLPCLKNHYAVKDLEKKMDEKRNILPFSDGICYDLETNETREITPDDYVSITTGYAYPKQSNPEIRRDLLKILRTFWDDDAMVEYMLWSIALSLYGKNLRGLYFLWTGKGGNGKGLLIELIKHAFGDFFIDVPMNVLTQVSNEKDEKNNYIKNTRGKRFFNSQEARDGAVFNGETLKSLSGGSDTITTRGIFEKPVSFVPAFTMHLCVNSVPLTTGFGDSIKRRCVVVPFPFQFKEDHTYDPNDKFHRKQDITIKDKKFNQSAYRDEFMLMLIDAHKKGVVERPQMVDITTRDYTDANNPLADWLSSEYEKSNDLNDKSKWILANDLMKDYKEFPNADDDMTIRKFVPLMTDVNNYSKTKATNNFKVNGELRFKGVYIQGINRKKVEEPEENAEVEQVVVVKRRNIFNNDED